MEIFEYNDSVWEAMNRDFKSYKRSDSKLWRLQAIFLSPGLAAVVLYRLQDFFYRRKFLFLAYIVHRLNLNIHGLDILPGAEIGGGLRIDHPVGIVIGAGSRIGRDCIILQNVTMGTRFLDLGKYNDEFPTIGDRVTIGAGAVLLGGIRVGNGCTIGANSIVLANISDGETVYGVHKIE